MSDKQVRANKVRRLKTKCYYTDYVNHAVRFYLSTPDTLMMEGKRKSDVMNWIAVQTVFHGLKENEKQVLTEIYKLHHRLPEGVRMYCEKTGANERRTWILITKFSAAVARKRGLI